MDAAEIQVGWWWAMCCMEDLYPIKDAEELAEVRGYFTDGETFPAGAWPTAVDGIMALLAGEATEDLPRLLHLVKARFTAFEWLRRATTS